VDLVSKNSCGGKFEVAQVCSFLFIEASGVSHEVSFLHLISFVFAIKTEKLAVQYQLQLLSRQRMNNNGGLINNSPIGGYSQSSEEDSLLVSPVRESISSSLPISNNHQIMIYPPPNLVHEDNVNTVNNNNSAYGWKHVQDLLESDHSNDNGSSRRSSKGRRRRNNYNNSNSRYNRSQGDNDNSSGSSSDERIEFNLLNSTPSFIAVGNNSSNNPKSEYYSPRIKKRHSHSNNKLRMPYASTPNNTKSMFIGNGSRRNKNQSTYIPQHLRRLSSQKQQPMSNVSQQQAGSKGYNNSSVTQQQRSTQRKSPYNTRYNKQQPQQRRTPTKPYSTSRRSSYNQSRSPPPQPRQQPIPEMLMRQPSIQTSNVQSYNNNNIIGGYDNPLGSHFYELNESTYTNNNNSDYSPRDVPIPNPEDRRSVQQHNVTSIEAVSQQNSRVYHHPFEADYLNPNMMNNSRPSHNHEYSDKSYNHQHHEEEDEYTPRSQPIPYPEVISSGAASSAASLMQQYGSPSKKPFQSPQAQTGQSTSSNSSRHTSQDIHHQLMMQPSPTRSISTSQSTRSHVQFSPTIRSTPNNNTTISEIHDFSQLMSTVNASYPSPDRSYYSDDNNSSSEYDSSSPSKSLFSYWLPPSPTKGRNGNGVGAKGVFDVGRENDGFGEDGSSSFDTNSALYGDFANSTSYDTSTPAEVRRKKKSYTVAQSPTSPKSFIPRKSPHPTSLPRRSQALPSHSEQKRLERLDETYEEVEPRVAPQPEPRSTYFLNDEGQEDESSHDEDEHLRVNEQTDVTSRLDEESKKKKEQTQRSLLWESDSDSSSSSVFQATSRVEEDEAVDLPEEGWHHSDDYLQGIAPHAEDTQSIDCSDLVSVDTDVLRKELDVSLDTRIKRYSKMHHGFVLLQALARGTSTRKRIANDTDTNIRILKYVKLRDGFILLQAQVRGVLCRSGILADSITVSRMERYAKFHAGFVSLQAIVRGVQARNGLRRECQTSSQIDRYARATNGFIALQARVRGVILRSRIFHTSAIKIQALVRGVQHRMVVERMKETKLKCIVAATVIQREIRRWRCRSQFHKAILYKKSAAATSIQARFRGWKSRVDFHKAALVIKIQRCYRRHQSSLHNATNYRSSRVSLAIQSIARMYLARKNYLTMKEDHDQTQLTKSVNAATIIQSASRSWKCQRELLQMKTQQDQELQNRSSAAATTIQSSVRLWSRRKALLLELEEKTAASTLIQSVLRSRSCQKELSRRRIDRQHENEEKASTLIQAIARSWICQQELARRRKVIIRQRQEEKQKTYSSAATIIQSQVRSWKVRRDLILFSMSAVTIQRFYRRHSQYTIVKQTNLKLLYADKLLKSRQVAAATTIQSVVRAYSYKQKLLAKKVEVDHQAKRRQGDIAASTIQARFRGWKSRTEMDSIVVLVIKIQRCYRRHQSSLRHAHIYNSVRGSLVIQSVARMYLARKKFINMKKHHDKTQLVLSIWECQRELVRRKEEADREMIQVAVVKIQSLVRSWSCRRDLLVATKHAAMIQRCYRKFLSNASNKHQLRLTHYADELWKSREVAAATKIQSVARSWICQRELIRLKEQARQVIKQHQEAAVISIQSIVRSWLSQKELSRRKYIAQTELNNQMMAAIKIQALVRRWLCQKELVLKLEHARDIELDRKMRAATTIQSIVRSQRSKQELLKRREAYQAEVDAATLIQSVVRSLIAKGILRDHRQRLAHRVDAATIIQSVVRSWNCQKELLQEIENHEAELSRMQLQASLVIQASSRMYIVSKKLVKANHSALMIQNTWRRHCRRVSYRSISDDYASALRSTLHLQSRLREIHELSIEETSMKSMDRSACIIQARWRGASVRQQMSLLTVSVLAIQSLWRRFSEKRHQQNKFQHYQTTLSSITRTQSTIRRKIADSRFEKLSSSAKSIQRAFKTYMSRKCFLQVHHSAVVLQSIARRWLVRKVLIQRIKSCVIIQRAWWTYIFRAMPPWSFVKANYHHLLAVDGSIRERIPKRSVLYMNFHHSVVLLQRVIRGHLVRRRVDRLQQSHSSSPFQTDNNDHTTTSSYSTSSNLDSSSHNGTSALHRPQFDNDENENPQLDIDHPLKKHDVEDIICIQSLARRKILNHQITAYNSSASIIQKSWRKYMLAKEETESYQRYHVLLEQAVVLTQQRWRGYIRRQQEIQHSLAATKLQAISRSWSCRRKVSQMLLVRAQEQELYEMTTAAIVIQSQVRSWMRRNDLAEMRKHDATLAATTIQAMARRWICQSELLLLRDQQTQAIERKSTAATHIQTQIRSRQCRRRFSQLKQQAQAIELNQAMSIAATTIQSSVRVWICQQDLSRRRKERIRQGQELLQKKSSSAATTIQALVRSYQGQHELSILTKHAVKIQRYYRRYSQYASDDMALLKMSYADELLQRHESNATITLQAVSRSWLCRITLRREKELAIKEQQMIMQVAVVKIQSLVRSWSCRRDLLVATKHAAMIQRCYRTFLSNASNAHQLRLTHYADELWKSREVAAATKIQSVARSWICQRELIRLKEQARQVIKQHQEAAVISIQSIVRSWLSQKELSRRKYIAQTELNNQMMAAIKIQALVRRWLCQKELVLKLEHARDIELDRKMRAATTIQSIVRSQRSKQELLKRREAYQAEVDAATLIQSVVRSLVVKGRMRDHQQRLGHRVASATIIQSVVRSWNCQQLQRTRQTSASSHREASVIMIQARIRGFLFRNTFSKANNAARTIQCAWRRCVISLRVKLLQVFTLASREDSSLGISNIPSPMKKARVLLPRDSQRLNRIRDITPHLPRHHECGVFVEEIMNSVTVVIQSAARRYLAKQKVLKRRQTISVDVLQDPSICEEPNDIEEHDSTMRFSSEDEDILILTDIYEHVQAELPPSTNSLCVAQCAKR